MKCPKCGSGNVREYTWDKLLACNDCRHYWLKDPQAEIDRLTQELATLKYTIVTTIGGVDYEGFPTSEINYLQRLRILLEKEQELANLEDSFQTIARENNEFEKELATEREKVRKLRAQLIRTASCSDSQICDNCVCEIAALLEEKQ